MTVIRVTVMEGVLAMVNQVSNNNSHHHHHRHRTMGKGTTTITNLTYLTNQYLNKATKGILKGAVCILMRDILNIHTPHLGKIGVMGVTINRGIMGEDRDFHNSHHHHHNRSNSNNRHIQDYNIRRVIKDNRLDH